MDVTIDSSDKGSGSIITRLTFKKIHDSLHFKIMGPNGENVRRRDDDVVKKEGAF